MRPRIQSVPEVKDKPKPPPLTSSRSLTFHSGSESRDMQLISNESVDNGFSGNGTGLRQDDLTSKGRRRASSNTENCYQSSKVKDGIAVSASPPCDHENMVPYTGVTSGRPTSISSVSSSRTSRGSDYFSSSSSGVQFEDGCDPSEGEVGAIRSTLNKVVEAVREEEEEEGFVDGESPPGHSVSKHYNNSSNKEERSVGVVAFVPEVYPATKSSTCEVTVKEINKKLSEVDHLSPIATMAMVANPQLTYIDRVILELLETERMYVRALEDILAGYIIAIKNTPGLPLTSSDTQYLFGNVKEIYAFNRKFLSVLENCDSDPVKVADHFVKQDASFSVYTDYCTNYPVSVATLTRCMRNPVLVQFFKTQQESLRHNLPLGSYLLKPVQRILKYHLILQELVKKCEKSIDGYVTIEKALRTMTNIARHINDMKRKHEDAIHIQEIQSLLTNWQGEDLTTYGDIVMEGDLKLQGAKNDRLVILFDKMILITKRHEEGFLVCKTHIMCSDLILLESMKENPLGFLISPFDNSASHGGHATNNRAGKQYVLTAKTLDDKKSWTHEIKRLILKNHHAAIPLQAQQSIMNMNTIGIDDPVEGHRVTLRRISSNLSTAQLMNGRPRRRSDSASRKGLVLRPWKRHEMEMSDDLSSDSVPNTPTISFGKGRFSFPKIVHSTSPKPDVKPDEALNFVAEAKEAEPEPEEKKKKEPKRSEKYKDSVIYRRHKRRTSQPITDVEKRLSVRAPSDVEDGEEKKKEEDKSAEDFDCLEDFLSFNLSNRRESISWDKQIVEPFFEQLKQEKERKETELHSATAESALLIPMPRRQPAVSTGSTSDSSDSDSGKAESRVEDAISRNRLLSDRDSDLSRVADHVSNSTTNQGTIGGKARATRPAQNEEAEKRSSSTVKPGAAVEDVGRTKTTQANAKSANGGSPIVVHKLKRSLSTQASHADRRRYFDRLKELRDRRHSQLNLGSDAKTIQTGRVREMIEHHREQMLASQSQLASPPAPDPVDGRSSHDGNKVQRRASESSDCFFDKLSPPLSLGRIEAPRSDSQASVVLRSKRKPERRSTGSSLADGNRGTRHRQVAANRQKYRSADLDTTDTNKRFSTITTASLPLRFTSSSSCSSGSGNEGQSSANSPKIAPKFKSILQPQMLLWRSYLEDSESHTRRSTNLIIETSPECGHRRSGCSDSNRKSSSLSPENDRKFLFKDLSNIEVGFDLQKDKMSEQVDHVWDNFESSEANAKPKRSSPSRLRPHSEAATEPRSMSERNPAAATPSKTIGSHSTNCPATKSATPGEIYHRIPTTSSIDLGASADNQRQGRTRERTADNANTTTSIVMRLAQQFNHMASATTQQPIIRRPQGRSHSAGSRKHLSDLRFSRSSVTPSFGQVDYDDVQKQTKTDPKRRESLTSQRKTERYPSQRLSVCNQHSNSATSPGSSGFRKSPEDPTERSAENRSTRTISHSRSNCLSAPSSLSQPLRLSTATPVCDDTAEDKISVTADPRRSPPSRRIEPEAHSSSSSTTDFVSRFCKT